MKPPELYAQRRGAVPASESLVTTGSRRRARADCGADQRLSSRAVRSGSLAQLHHRRRRFWRGALPWFPGLRGIPPTLRVPDPVEPSTDGGDHHEALGYG